MKKKLIYVLLASLSISLICNENQYKSVKANESESENTDVINSDEYELETTDLSDYIISIDGVGKSINLAKHEYLDHNNIKLNNPIFDPDWDAEQIKVKTTLNQTTTDIVNANSFEGIIEELETNAGLSSTYSNGYSLFTATADAKFDDSTVGYPDYTYQYYSSYSYKIKSFAYELPNYKTNLAMYQRNLSDAYYDDAEMFLNEEMDRTTFFDKYGTHIIAKAVFGGSFDISYSVSSSFYDVWRGYYSAISSYLNTSLYSKVSAGDTSGFDVFSNFSFHPELAAQHIEYVTRGGSNSIDITHTNLQAAFTQWSTSVSSSPKIIEVTSDGLIPLWEILPVAYNTQEYKNYFIQQYQLYTASYEDSVLEKYTPSIFSITNGVETKFTFLRVGEAVITDDGFYNQEHYDVAHLDNDFDLKFSYMKEHGYTMVDIYLQLKIREINMGYQLIGFFCSETPSDAYLIDTFEYEYGGTSFNDEYGSTIGFVRYNIPMSMFDSNDPKIVFRYSARGSGEDNWENRLVYTNIVYFK